MPTAPLNSTCGSSLRITYPFWVSSRPSYCGHPAFKLECHKGLKRSTVIWLGVGAATGGVILGLSFSELEEATNHFSPEKQIGKGGFGNVYHGTLTDGREVAIKRMYDRSNQKVEQSLNEVDILAKLRHKHLVTLYGCRSQQGSELLLVYEFISNGTCTDHLRGSKANLGLLTWPVRLNIAIETASALDVIHRDVKTQNILLDKDLSVKVGDFGISRLFPVDLSHVSTTPQGTPGYVDPEYYRYFQAAAKSDAYSFGVVLAELLSSKKVMDSARQRDDINLANMFKNRYLNSAMDEFVDPLLGFENEDVKEEVMAMAR
ncbi:LEAF RUST 10 DISEASE-RESISTANCE LOCUS RECEPTOR-LIKE PROTEIN KINASE-like 1.4 [Silene latifolia]|uniref:LEAF RUST 10 DISEASE-RESISTANCE LOCUS RECEPTOR-LIKE PROTEIN KINASE-like 1.4 n=1 Tax=Silene latifolia TaxID=37657 RepID=UPI003D780ADE